jgi:7-cyano-7-deazaguanine synthase in queuosine biosynthesis
MHLDYIHIATIPIGLYKDGPVGVGISGGADSAVLLYIIMSNIKQPIHIYNMWSDYRKSVFKKSVDSVIEACSRLTGNTNYIVHKMQIEPDESVEFYFDMLTDALDKKEIDIVYLGITNFPPAEVYLGFEQQQQSWHNKFRSDVVEHPVFGLTIEHLNLDTRAYVPLRNYNKKDIARLYRSLNLEQSLLPVTRSCEDDDHSDSHCGKCWWCQERIWAFGSLGE